MGTTFASFHAGGKCDDVRSMLKYSDRGSESSPAPSRSSRGLNKSGPHALDGSIKGMASKNIVRSNEYRGECLLGAERVVVIHDCCRQLRIVCKNKHLRVLFSPVSNCLDVVFDKGWYLR